MKKYVAIVGLALLLIGIAYVRAIFSHQDRTDGFPSEVGKAIPANVLDDYVMKEEAASRLDSVRRIYADSLGKMQEIIAASEDSKLAADSLKSLLDELSHKLEAAEKEARQARSAKESQFEKLVAGFYKGEVSRLPADLSTYEHEVSVNEIRDKAKKYFGINSKKLDRIIKKYR